MGQRNAASLGGIVPVVESQLIFNTAASYDVNKWLQLTARVTNFTNLHYQTMYGYAGPGIAVYGGFNVKL
jgi:outer membrane cobalamin receptor